MKHIRLSVGVLFVLSLLSAHAQEDNDVEFQLWLDHVMWHPVSKKMRVGGDIGARGFVSNSDWNQLYLRPAMQYKFNKNLTGATGISYWRTNNKYDGVDNVNELRFHQDIELVDWPKLGFVKLYFRLRFEERFFFYQSIPNDWYMRARYMPGIQTNDFKIGSQIFFLMGLAEGFKPIINNSSPEIFIDRFRVKGIVAHKFKPNWRYEIHFLLQNSRVLSDDGFERANNIIRIRLFHVFPYKKNEEK